MKRFVHLLVPALLALGLGAVCCSRMKPPLEPQVLVSDNPRAEKAFRSAEKRFEAGDYRGAFGEFTAFIAAFPADPLSTPAYLYCGRIALELGELETASTYFQSIAGKKNSTEERAAFYIGIVYFEQGKVEEAIDVLRRYVGRLFDQDENLLLYNCLWRSAAQVGAPIDVVVWTDDYLDLEPSAEEAAQAREAQSTALAAIESPKMLQKLSMTIEPEKELWLAVMERHARIEFEAGQFEEALEVVERAELGGAADDSTIGEIGRLIRKRLTVDLSSIGCILPISGRSRLVGQTVLEGVMLGADLVEIGPDRHRLAVVTRDSQSDAQEAVQAVDELVQVENVALIVGLIDSKAGLAAAQRAEEYGVPVIALSVREEITAGGDNVFRHFVTNRAEVRALVQGYQTLLDRRAELQGEAPPAPRLGVLYPRNGYGQQMKALVEAELDALGTPLVTAVEYAPDKTSFTEEAAALADYDFDGLIIPDGHNRIGLIAPALAAAGLWSSALDNPGVDGGERREIQLLIPSVGYGEDLQRRAGRYLEGAVFARRYFEGAGESSERFAFRFRDRYGKEPTHFSAYGYDAVVIAASALQGEYERRREIREWLQNLESPTQLIEETATEFDGFDENGEPRGLPLLVRFLDGVLEVLRP